MTPFGSLLRFYRNERGIPLTDLARQIPLSVKILSAIETGRRRPPGREDISAIAKVLNLIPTEAAALAEAAQYSTPLLRLPENATPREYRLAHRVVSSLRRLSEPEMAAIHAVLDGELNLLRR